MLTPRQARFAFIPLVVIAMSGIISFTMTVLHHGVHPGLMAAWLQHWPLAFAVALPAAWLVLPGVRALLARLTREPAALGRKFGEMG
ncbi:uncharacterized protein DUF2798 [Luteimonas cucumeris]|uniref:Uncharacterized protein DUF2798 n=1 Tax=Luteimonas cucumeris TaxID=985012 RepID=A0A562L071_9GAMM|nr:DUF2798 domain-containing protein [Luteimonas cucumeris]TWI01032.1 uncharacterized protein DUF2798 [Luteimonas cucumeris]